MNFSELAKSNASIAHKLSKSNMNLNVLRTNAVLLKDDWLDVDDRVLRVAEERLKITSSLLDAGLSYDVGGIGATQSEWQREGDLTPATLSMEPDSMDNRDILQYDLQVVPIPVIHKDFRLGLRQMEATKRMGSNIDMANVEAAARKVARGIEDLVVFGLPNGTTIGGMNLYGVTTHPDRITGTAAGNWATDIDAIYETVLNMLQAADNIHRYGPFELFVSAGLSLPLYNFYNDGSGQTVKARLEQLDQISKITVSDSIPNGDLVLIQMEVNTIDLAIAQQLITIEWDERGGLNHNYKILAALAPRIKPDANGELGIVHYSGALTQTV